MSAETLPRGTKLRKLLELASRSEGVNNAEARAETGWADNIISGLLSSATSAGQLTRAQVDGLRLRWFADPARALEWQASTKPLPRGGEMRAAKPFGASEMASPVLVAPVASRFTKPAQEIKFGRGKRSKSAAGTGEVIVPPGVKIKVCPGFLGFDPRYQVDPAAALAPFGAGFAAVGTGRDVRTGREWREDPAPPPGILTPAGAIAWRASEQVQQDQHEAGRS